MTTLLRLIQRGHDVCDQKSHFDLSDINLIEDAASHLETLRSIDWTDGEFYDLLEVLQKSTKKIFLQKTPDKTLDALEPLFALLPDRLNQTKGLLQSEYYQEFIERVLKTCPQKGIDLIDKGMAQGRLLYMDGENFSCEQQSRIISYFGKSIISYNPDFCSQFWQVFDQHHDSICREKFYQKMLYEVVSNAQVEAIEPLVSYMSLRSLRTKSQVLIAREELFSMQWMEKAVNMNLALGHSIYAREQCAEGSFDQRVWNMVDWIETHITPENTRNVVWGISLLAEDLCCMNEENTQHIEKIQQEDHPIYSYLWNNPHLIGHRTEVVTRLLELVDSLSIPTESGCAVAWMLYSRLHSHEQNISEEFLKIFHQHPPYIKMQLEKTVAGTPKTPTGLRKI